MKKSVGKKKKKNHKETGECRQIRKGEEEKAECIFLSCPYIFTSNKSQKILEPYRKY